MSEALLPWQHPLFSDLARQLQQDRLPHALLFSGLQGIGKRHFAQAFAHYALCQRHQDQGPCRECSACLLVAAGSHPDLRHVGPESSSRVIRIEQIRETVDFMGKTANQGGRKVVIIQPAEAMNANAANALLKTLEEPPAGALLMLVSDQPGLILATLRSRCRHLRFPLPPQESALDWLAAQAAVDSPETLLALAEGAPLRALSLADPERRQWQLSLAEVLAAVVKEQCTLSDAASRLQGADFAAIVEGMLLCLQDILRAHQSGTPATLRASAHRPVLEGLGSTPSAALHELYRELLSTRETLVKNMNPNPRLGLEALLHFWGQLSRSR